MSIVLYRIFIIAEIFHCQICCSSFRCCQKCRSLSNSLTDNFLATPAVGETTWGNDDQIWRAYFSRGLKPPTNLVELMFLKSFRFLQRILSVNKKSNEGFLGTWFLDGHEPSTNRKPRGWKVAFFSSYTCGPRFFPHIFFRLAGFLAGQETPVSWCFLNRVARGYWRAQEK